MFILQHFGFNLISMGDDKTWELAWIDGYSNGTMDNGTLNEATSNCT
jgi:hypothetical protein